MPSVGVAATELIQELQDEYMLRDGGPGETPVGAVEFAPPAGGFVVATLDGDAIGCGGFRRLDDQVFEIKHRFVRPA